MSRFVCSELVKLEMLYICIVVSIYLFFCTYIRHRHKYQISVNISQPGRYTIEKVFIFFLLVCHGQNKQGKM